MPLGDPNKGLGAPRQPRGTNQNNNRQDRQGGLPNPNERVQFNPVTHNSGQQYNMPSNRRAPQQRRQMTGSPLQNGMPNGNGVPLGNPMMPNGMPNNMPNNMQNGMLNGVQSTPPPKKKGKGCLVAVLVSVVVFVGGLFVLREVNKNKVVEEVSTTPQIYELSYEDTGRYTLDCYIDSIRKCNKAEITSVAPQSWVAQELDYANSIEVRESWIKSVCNYVKFSYPMTEAKDAYGNIVYDENGATTEVESDLLNGEEVTVSVIDYNFLAETMKEEVQIIYDMYESSNISPSDYNYKDEMVDLMLEYLLRKANYPTKDVQMSFQFESADGSLDDSVDDLLSDDSLSDDYASDSDSGDTDGILFDDENSTSETATEEISEFTGVVLTDDSELDNLLFASEDYHNMLDTFGKLINDYEYEKEADALKAEKDAYTDNVKKIKENIEKMKLEATEKGATVEELKKLEEDELAKIPEFKETKAKFARTYVAESVIPYTWCGAYFAQNVYEGTSNKMAQQGDGTFDYPAGIGTTVITKAYDIYGNFHDVKVTLLSYYIGQEAIDYAISFSEKNRGFDSSSAVQLICYELSVENLESEEITISSDMYLADIHSNKSAKTGSMYGFYSTMTIPPFEKAVINDWATSTDLIQKYVCWGKSFDRQFPAVWFRLLAGSGAEIPTYSATESYVNRNVAPEENFSDAKDRFNKQNEFVTTVVSDTAPEVTGEVIGEVTESVTTETVDEAQSYFDNANDDDANALLRDIFGE